MNVCDTVRTCGSNTPARYSTCSQASILDCLFEFVDEYNDHSGSTGGQSLSNITFRSLNKISILDVPQGYHTACGGRHNNWWIFTCTHNFREICTIDITISRTCFRQRCQNISGQGGGLLPTQWVSYRSFVWSDGIQSQGAGLEVWPMVLWGWAEVLDLHFWAVSKQASVLLLSTDTVRVRPPFEAISLRLL